MKTQNSSICTRKSAGFAIMIVLFITGCSSAPVQVPTETVFYPGPPDAPRIQFLTSITSEQDIGVERNRFKEFVTGKADAIMAIARPWDLDHVPGKLYVSDKNFRQIIVVDLENKRMSIVDDRVGGSLSNPGGIFVDAAGYKYIADRDRGQSRPGLYPY
jgi:hypothetical protein